MKIALLTYGSLGDVEPFIALAEALDHLNPLTQGLYAALLNNAGNCEGAIEHAEKGLAIEPVGGIRCRELRQGPTFDGLGTGDGQDGQEKNKRANGLHAGLLVFS